MVYDIEREFVIKNFTEQDAYLIWRCMDKILKDSDEMSRFDGHEKPVMIRINESMRNLSVGKSVEVNESMWWMVTQKTKTTLHSKCSGGKKN